MTIRGLGCGISNSVVVPDLAAQSRTSDVPSKDFNNGMRALTSTNKVDENFEYC